MDLLDKAIRFGPGFKKPSTKVLRALKATKGPTDFSPDEIQRLLAAASPGMRAMIMLGINSGIGPANLAALAIATATRFHECLDYARSKTGIARKIPLWTETAKAIAEALEHRRQPADEADAALLFIGRRGAAADCGDC